MNIEQEIEVAKSISEFEKEISAMIEDARLASSSLRGVTKDRSRIIKFRQIMEIIGYIGDRLIEYRRMYEKLLREFTQAEAIIAANKNSDNRLNPKERKRYESLVVYESSGDGEIRKTNRVHMFSTGGIVNGDPCVSFKDISSMLYFARQFNGEIKTIEGKYSIVLFTNSYASQP